MIEVTPFVNPFKKPVPTQDGIEIVHKNGKTYKKVVKK